MRCKECGGNKFDAHEWVDEMVCLECGLVVAGEFPEHYSPNFALGGKICTKEKIGARLRSISSRSSKDPWRDGISHCMLIASEYSKNIKEQVAAHYIALGKRNLLGSHPYEERAAAVVLYTLKENGISCTVKEISSFAGADTPRVHKLVRKYARFLGKPWVLSQNNPQGDFERIAQRLQVGQKFVNDCLDMYVTVDRGLHVGIPYMGAIAYMVAKMGKYDTSQTEIASVVGCSVFSLRENVRKICKGIGMDTECIQWMNLVNFLEEVK